MSDILKLKQLIQTLAEDLGKYKLKSPKGGPASGYTQPATNTLLGNTDPFDIENNDKKKTKKKKDVAVSKVFLRDANGADREGVQEVDPINEAVASDAKLASFEIMRKGSSKIPYEGRDTYDSFFYIGPKLFRPAKMTGIIWSPNDPYVYTYRRNKKEITVYAGPKKSSVGKKHSVNSTVAKNIYKDMSYVSVQERNYKSDRWTKLLRNDVKEALSGEDQYVQEGSVIVSVEGDTLKLKLPANTGGETDVTFKNKEGMAKDKYELESLKAVTISVIDAKFTLSGAVEGSLNDLGLDSIKFVNPKVVKSDTGFKNWVTDIVITFKDKGKNVITSVDYTKVSNDIVSLSFKYSANQKALSSVPAAKKPAAKKTAVEKPAVVKAQAARKQKNNIWGAKFDKKIKLDKSMRGLGNGIVQAPFSGDKFGVKTKNPGIDKVVVITKGSYDRPKSDGSNIIKIALNDFKIANPRFKGQYSNSSNPSKNAWRYALSWLNTKNVLNSLNARDWKSKYAK
jgi:hypothetical protein